MKIVYVRKVKGSGLTKTQKALLGTSAALLGVAGAAALAHRSQQVPYAIDRVKADMDAEYLNKSRAPVSTTPVPIWMNPTWGAERIDDVESPRSQIKSNQQAYLKSRTGTKELQKIPLRKRLPTLLGARAPDPPDIAAAKMETMARAERNAKRMQQLHEAQQAAWERSLYPIQKFYDAETW